MKIPTLLLALLLTQTAWAADLLTLRINYQKGSIAQSPCNNATPVLRAGLTDVLLTGILIRCGKFPWHVTNEQV